MCGSREDADSDEIFDDISAVLDAAEQVLRDGGWQLLLQTGNALLGAKMIPTGRSADSVCAAALVTADELAAALADRANPAAEVHVNLTLHAADALLKGGGDAAEIVGGGITAINEWAPQERRDGLSVSPAFVAARSG